MLGNLNVQGYMRFFTFSDNRDKMITTINELLSL